MIKRRSKLQYQRPPKNRRVEVPPEEERLDTHEESEIEDRVPTETEPELNPHEEDGSSDSSVEGDDCPVIDEDRQGFRETEPELIFEKEVDEGEEEELVDVEICGNLEEHFGSIAVTDANAQEADDSGDDVWDDENIPDPLSDDDQDEAARPFTQQEGPDVIIAIGKTFNNADEFKYALLRLGAKCTQHAHETDPCSWRVYCSFERSRNKLMVKFHQDEHVCIRSGRTKLLKSGSIAQLYEERLRLNPKIKSKEMVAEIKREYNMIVSVHQCTRAKKLVKDRRKASHESQFARIWDYQEEIRISNPGSTIEIETIPGSFPGSLQRFYRLYICFDALKTAWKESCRPIIGLDAAFMKCDIKGQMLGAVGRDGDNRIFPIAWAVVEVEDNQNWMWFVQLLRKDLRLEDGASITIISDKHQGLLNAVHNELPKAEHRLCARHVLENWKKTNKDIVHERMFWKIARSYTNEVFEDNLAALKKYNQGAYDSLQRTEPRKWSRAFFKLGSCCNDNLNNLSESFNRNVRESRRMPLLDMLKDVRRKCMERNARRTLLTKRWKKRFTPRADREIELQRIKSKDCKRLLTVGNEHEVDFHGDAYRVDTDAKTCGCGFWQLNGIPCMHAMCVITNTKLNVENYVSDYYLTSKWRQLYDKGIRPVQGMKLWRRLNRLPVLPPPARVVRGRPHNHARRKGPLESSTNPYNLTRHGRVGTCSNCKNEGHNMTRCPNPPAPPQAKRPRGRPRKDQGQSSQSTQVGDSQRMACQGGST